MRTLAARGEDHLGRAIERTLELKEALHARVPDLDRMDDPAWIASHGDRIGGCDLVKTTVGLSRYDLSGYDVAQALVGRGIVIEKAGLHTITLITTFQLGPEAVPETVEALHDILAGHCLPGDAREPMPTNPFSAIDDRPVIHPYLARRYAKSIGHEVVAARGDRQGRRRGGRGLSARHPGDPRGLPRQRRRRRVPARGPRQRRLDRRPRHEPRHLARPVTLIRMTDFETFDTRGYRTVDVRSGYGEWVTTYEQTVEDAMDIHLLEALGAVPWAGVERAADLGCGTGRTGAWLRERGIAAIDGVDLTPEMLDVARAREVYASLVEADVSDTGLASAAYDLVVTCLVDEHLADLRPLYAEARRLARPGGVYVLVGFHPHFIMASGMPTHYDSASGEPVAIQTYVHLLSDHVSAGLAAGWTLVEMRERVIDDAWLELKPKWASLRDQPIAFAVAWRAPPRRRLDRRRVTADAGSRGLPPRRHRPPLS